MSIIKRKSGSAILHPFKTAAIIFVAILVFIGIAKWTPASTILHNTQAQFYKISSGLNTYIVQTFSSSESLKSQLETYKNLSSEYLVESSYLDELEKRVYDLEKLIGYSQSVDYKTIAARILSRSPSQSYTLLIDQGSHDGIKTGLPAVVGDGHLIGVVDSVSEYTSTIRLLEDNSTRIPVSILGQSDTSGLLVGESGFLLSMEYIPQDRELNIGDAIITSNLHERIPDGLVIGTIYEIIKEETASFQQAMIEPIYQSTSYSNVLIIDTTSVRIYEE
ncbi:rod shape-determining protein MreC [Candidatus Uhrbacteria bacterium]|jgi:rod shape-determining protein MreC|nr:rod shape-determining protein MreC [Candidatus Uhrbacteria bacterium]MBT7717442.1 rod shape-determining protein MreC [Candidatus Uhrbacteria bacterium]